MGNSCSRGQRSPIPNRNSAITRANNTKYNKKVKWDLKEDVDDANNQPYRYWYCNYHFVHDGFFVNGIIIVNKHEIHPKYMKGFDCFIANFNEGVLVEIMYIKRNVYYYMNAQHEFKYFKEKERESKMFIFSYPDYSMFHGKLVYEKKFYSGVFAFKNDPLDKIYMEQNGMMSETMSEMLSETLSETKLEANPVEHKEKNVYIDSMDYSLVTEGNNFVLIYGLQVKGKLRKEGYFHKNKLIQEQQFGNELYNRYAELDDKFRSLFELYIQRKIDIEKNRMNAIV